MSKSNRNNSPTVLSFMVQSIVLQPLLIICQETIVVRQDQKSFKVERGRGNHNAIQNFAALEATDQALCVSQLRLYVLKLGKNCSKGALEKTAPLGNQIEEPWRIDGLGQLTKTGRAAGKGVFKTRLVRPSVEARWWTAGSEGFEYSTGLKVERAIEAWG
eukprot:Gb_05143 [translate_table: standard]